MAFTIRKIERRDERRWRELFDGSTLFYEREPSEAIRRHTWTNLINAASSVHAMVEVSDSGDVIGIANNVIHENTSALARMLPPGFICRPGDARIRRGKAYD
jgi:hypothetical protein